MWPRPFPDRPRPASARWRETSTATSWPAFTSAKERPYTIPPCLIDRKGNVAGKYRKVYLPREELEVGLTPGSDFPVFKTDFGKVGLMICWDVQYTDPARALALGGAELILLPIWGGDKVIGKARAMENHVYLAASGYDYPTYIMDPNGEILAEARNRGDVAHATVDLNRRYVDSWLGDMRGRFMKEVRLDLK